MNELAVTHLAGGRLRRYSPRDYAQVRLCAFPYAGGRPLVFQSWPDGLPRRCELLGVSYPGRGARLGEEPLHSIVALAEEAADAIALHSEVPFALYGHSMGATIAFETARVLRARREREPFMLFVSGQAAPSLSAPVIHRAARGDDVYLERLRAMGGTPVEILENAEMMGLLMPAIRADFHVCDTYQYVQADPLAAAITAFAAVNDREVSVEDVEAWREHTSGEFEFHVMVGGHFFIHAAQPALLQAITAGLDAHGDDRRREPAPGGRRGIG